MGYSNPEIRSFNGLYLQKNSFNVPDGALEVARNLVVAKDGILTKRRGYYEYYDPGVGTLNNVVLYDSKLVALLESSMVSFTDGGTSPNETGTASTYSGATIAITAPRVGRFAAANRNLYFTTDNGAMKVESATTSVTSVQKAGTPGGLDLRGNFENDVAAKTPIVGNTQVYYRIVFGKRDYNDNLLLGAPGDILALTNSKVEGATWVQDNGGLATTTITVTYAAHGLVSGQTLAISDSAGGTPNITAGTYTITVTGANTFTFEVSNNTLQPGPGLTLSYSAYKKARLSASIPSEIAASMGYFYQVYRSSQSATAGDTPTQDYKFIEEKTLTSSEITAGVFFYTDEIPDILRGAELYTNSNSREGELQANTRPPKCDDIEVFKNHVIYARATTRHTIELDVVDASTLANGDTVSITVDGATRVYEANTGIGNRIVTATASGTGTITITYTAHGLSTGDSIYVSKVNTGATLPVGTYTITVLTADTFTISSPGNTASTVEIEGVAEAGGNRIFYLNNASSSVSTQLRDTAQGLTKAINRDPSSSIYGNYVSAPVEDVPGRMRFTSKGFGSAIGLAANTTTAGSSFFPALTTSAADTQSKNEVQQNALYIAKLGEPEAVPIVNVIRVGVRNSEILRIKALRDSLIIIKEDGVFRMTGDTVSSFSITPIDTTVVCRAKSSVQVLNNNVMFLSNQGVCQVTESSVLIVSRVIEDVIQPILTQSNLETETGSASYESERLYLLSTLDLNQTTATVVYAYNILNETWTQWDTLFSEGVVGPKDTMFLITSQNVIARERKKQTLVDYCGQNYACRISSIVSDGESGTITVLGVVPEVGDVIVKNNVFTRITAITGAGPLFDVTFQSQSNLQKVTGVSWVRSANVVTITSPGHGKAVGDTIYIDNSTGGSPITPGIYTIATVPGINTFTVAETASNSSGTCDYADQVTLYSKYDSEFKLAPFHAGQIGLMKQFAQMQMHFKNSAPSRLNVSFTNYTFGGSEEVEWINLLVFEGWGLFPWGFAPWGQENGVRLSELTQPSGVCRVYIPKFGQRTTFIQPYIQHKIAGEQINLQALSFAVRPYKERVSK